ncbi:MAG: GNAT family N-acetyltransferase [Acidimicrobiales bacterium]
MDNPWWPLFGLRLRTPRLELRLLTDDDILAVCGFLDDLHDPAVMPFERAFTDLPSPEREQGAFRHFWTARATWRPDAWEAAFAVRLDGATVGVQSLRADAFATVREVDTGSYLRRAVQGRGIGTEMRVAVLALAFEGLGARWARSGAFRDNESSRRVSEKLGYRPDGIEVKAPRGQPVVSDRFRLDGTDWSSTRDRWPSVTIEGLEACRSWFGA